MSARLTMLRLTALVGLTLVLICAACGGGGSSPSAVVRAWSKALDADDNERAASLFARGAAVVQGGRLVYLHTHRDAFVWNARLPCAGRIVALRTSGSAVTATFRLHDRKRGRCGDPPGAEAIALLVVEHGKIVLWDQIGSQLAIGH